MTFLSVLGKNRMPIPRPLLAGSATKAFRAALSTVQRVVLEKVPFGCTSHGGWVVSSGTGQFIEPVMSTMKYRSTGMGSPFAELVAHAESGSNVPLAPVPVPLPDAELPPDPTINPFPPVPVPLADAAVPPVTCEVLLPLHAAATKKPTRTGATSLTRI